MDFAIALLLFTFTVAVYFGYTGNLQKQEGGKLDLLAKDAKAMSSALALDGYPDDWNNLTVIRIGVIDDQKLNSTKLKAFKQLNYNFSKRRFGTIYDFFVYFVNEKDEVLNVNSVCGVGFPLTNLTYNIKSAYYYSDDDDDFLLGFMNDSFKADIYFGDNPSNNNDIDALKSNISKYQLLVMEHPLLSTSNYNSIKDSINNFSSSGNFFMISGELTSAQGRDLVGADFYKKSGQSSSDLNSTVNNTDEYLTLSVGENIVFRQAYYVENTSSATSFKQIATFNKDGKNALSKWKYGNGTIYFFSDFDTSFFNGNFVEKVIETVQGFIEGTCTPVSITAEIIPKDLVKIERYVIYNSKPVKMILYMWQ